MIQHTLILSSVRFQIFCESVSSCLVFESSYNCGVNLQIECAQQIIKRYQNQILFIATSLTALWNFNGQNAKEVHQYIVFSKPLRICHIKTYLCWSHSKWMTRAHNPFIPIIITPKQMMSSGFVLYLFQKIIKRPIIFFAKKGVFTNKKQWNQGNQSQTMREFPDQSESGSHCSWQPTRGQGGVYKEGEERRMIIQSQHGLITIQIPSWKGKR